MLISNFDANVCIKQNIGLPTLHELRFMSFGRFIEENKKITAFINDPATKTTHLSIKRKSVAQAFRQFKDLYNVDRFYARFDNGQDRKDDAFLVYYTEKR